MAAGDSNAFAEFNMMFLNGLASTETTPDKKPQARKSMSATKKKKQASGTPKLQESSKEASQPKALLACCVRTPYPVFKHL